MWPFKPKAARPSRAVPTPPYIDGTAWAQVGTTLVTARAAENLAAVLAAVNAIACTIAALPAYVVRADDSRADVPDHPLQKLIDYGVSSDETWSDFLEGLLASSLLRGNALAAIETDTAGRLRALRTLPWPQITPYVDDNGVLLFDFIPTVPPNAGKRRRYLRDDVLFVKDRSDSGVLGVSRLTRAAGALGIALDLQRNSATFMTNASRPGGYLTTPNHMNDDIRARNKQEWDVAYRGEELGRIALLSGGMEYKNLGLLTAEDAELVAQRNFSVADVARIFGVPPWLLADPSRATFASSSAAMKAFTMTTLLPWTRKVESAFAQSVLSTQYRLRIDLDSLIKADITELYGALLKARQGGWLSPNDARSETGWPRVADSEADALDPPASGGKPASDGEEDSPSKSAAQILQLVRGGL